MFDVVLDSQSAYRKLLKAMAFVGEKQSIASEANKFNYEINASKTMQVLINMLLDADTSFCCINNEELAKQIMHITYCPQGKIDEASFILVQNQYDLLQAILSANKGTLENPQLGATIIYECDDLNSQDEYIIQGPGVDGEKCICLPNAKYYLEVRNNVNQEFPLGIDMIIIDKKGDLVALPRTTIIKEKTK